MKEVATSEGRILKCPMCRVPEKVPGKRSSYSYEYELSKLYSTVPKPVRQVSSQIWVQPIELQDETWIQLAEAVRVLPRSVQVGYFNIYPQLQAYINGESVQTREVRPRVPEYHAFCQSGNRENGTCRTRGKTERKCSHEGCDKFVCRSCRQCITH